MINIQIKTDKEGKVTKHDVLVGNRDELIKACFLLDMARRGLMKHYEQEHCDIKEQKVIKK